MRAGWSWAALFVCLLVSGEARAQSTSSGVFESADPILGPMMRPGRVVDRARFSHRRELRLYPSSDGVSRYAMKPDDLALARGDLRDVRLVDAAGRQAPYVVTFGRQRLPAKVLPEAGRAPRGKESHHLVELPAAPLTVVAVSIDVDTSYVDRHYRLFARLDGEEELVGAGTLSRRGAHAEVALPLSLWDDTRADSLRLVVDDGDDAPLAIGGAVVTTVAAELYVVAPTGAYTLLFGSDAAEAPRYELQGVRERVLSAAVGEAQAGPLLPNTSFVAAPEAVAPRERDQALLLWAAIGLSVLILGGLTLRVARSPGSPP